MPTPWRYADGPYGKGNGGKGGNKGGGSGGPSFSSSAPNFHLTFYPNGGSGTSGESQQAAAAPSPHLSHYVADGGWPANATDTPAPWDDDELFQEPISTMFVTNMTSDYIGPVGDPRTFGPNEGIGLPHHRRLWKS